MGKKSPTQPTKPISGNESALGPTPTRKRSRFCPRRRLEVAKVRKIGACSNCRQKKVGCIHALQMETESIANDSSLFPNDEKPLLSSHQLGMPRELHSSCIYQSTEHPTYFDHSVDACLPNRNMSSTGGQDEFLSAASSQSTWMPNSADSVSLWSFAVTPELDSSCAVATSQSDLEDGTLRLNVCPSNPFPDQYTVPNLPLSSAGYGLNFTTQEQSLPSRYNAFHLTPEPNMSPTNPMYHCSRNIFNTLSTGEDHPISRDFLGFDYHSHCIMFHDNTVAQTTPSPASKNEFQRNPYEDGNHFERQSSPVHGPSTSSRMNTSNVGEL